MAVTGCAPAGEAPSASFDDETRRLVQMGSDLNGDGRVEQWTYLDGNRPLRAELDADGNGLIDRWEYFDRNGTLERVGTSSAGDGIEDTWTWSEAPTGDRRVELSRGRDGAIDRREIYRGDVLVAAEEDANLDGRIESWHSFEGGRLREVRIDVTGDGRADRRMRYDADGQYVVTEAVQ